MNTVEIFGDYILETKKEPKGQVTFIFLNGPQHKLYAGTVFTSDLDLCTSVQKAKHLIATNFKKEIEVPTVAELKAQQLLIASKY